MSSTGKGLDVLLLAVLVQNINISFQKSHERWSNNICWKLQIKKNNPTSKKKKKRKEKKNISYKGEIKDDYGILRCCQIRRRPLTHCSVFVKNKLSCSLSFPPSELVRLTFTVSTTVLSLPSSNSRWWLVEYIVISRCQTRNCVLNLDNVLVLR